MPAAKGTTRTAERWAARPVAALAVRAIAWLAPIVASVVTARVVSRSLPRPAGILPVAGWWLGLCAVTTFTLFVADKVARRLLPLAALLKLSLVFPDSAPSRFRSAMRTGTVRELKDRVEEIKTQGLPEDPALAAETLIELIAALSAHDRMTRGHAERVRAYTRMIGEELKLDDDDLDRLQWAGLLHDAGKLFVPAEILNKTGRLTDEEFDTVRKHPTWGAALCEPLRGWLGDWVDAVGQHHEHWNGRGYPDGLAGTEISLAARIVSVADVYDVITSVRSYKKASGAVEGRAELARCAGTQFDPRMVRAFLTISLGRLRLVMGPLSWLAQLPGVGNVPLGPIAGATMSGLATVATLTVGGVLAHPADAHPRSHLVALAAVDRSQRTDRRPEPHDNASTDAVTTRATDDAPFSVAVVLGFEPPGQPTGDVARSVAPTPNADRPDGSRDPADPRPVDPPATPDPVEGTPPTGTPSTTVPPTVPRAAPPTVPPVPPVPALSTPLAADDTATMAEDATITVDVLANDSDADNDHLTIAAVASVDGTATTDGSSVTYTPEPDSYGAQTLTYTIDDGTGRTDTATVTVNVTPVDDPPSATDDAYLTAEGAPLSVPASGVLDNDSDLDGDALTATTVTGPAHGTLDLAGDGSFTYTPDVLFAGTDTFTYAISDGNGGTSTATVTITVNSLSIATTWYLGSGGTALSPAPGAISEPEADADGDGKPGLTIKNSKSGLAETDPQKFHIWTLNPVGGLVLDGPAHLQLWSSAQSFNKTKDVDYSVWLQECALDGTGCTTLASAVDVHVVDWNGGVPDWRYRDITIGNVQHAVPAGRILQVRIMFARRDVWVALSGNRPSAVVLTGP